MRGIVALAEQPFLLSGRVVGEAGAARATVRDRGAAGPGDGRLAAPVQALSRLLSRRPSAGEAFDCGVRVVEGTVDGEGWRWRYRSSVVAPKRPDGVTVLHHGRDVVLRLRIDGDATRHRLRPRYVLLTGEEVDSGARIRLSCRPDAASRLQARR